MTALDAMKQALDALEAYSPLPTENDWFNRHHEAIRNLRSAIKYQEKAEPLGYISRDIAKWDMFRFKKSDEFDFPVYDHPAIKVERSV